MLAREFLPVVNAIVKVGTQQTGARLREWAMLPDGSRTRKDTRRHYNWMPLRSATSPAQAVWCSAASKETELTREGLYKALSKDGNPSLGTVLKVLKALGLKLTAVA